MLATGFPLLTGLPQKRYTHIMSDGLRLRVVFFTTEMGREPVRERLQSLPQADRHEVGSDLLAVQYGWPIGLPLVRKLEEDLWEVRSTLGNQIARVLFTVSGDLLVPLHGFIKKSRKTAKGRPRPGQATATRAEEAHELNPAHLGSDFEDFLKEEGLFETVHTLAIKKMIAYKLLALLRQKHVTKDALAKRMKTSRASLDRLLDPNNPSVTLMTLSKAAAALGCTLRVELSETTP
jgi:phage-related protein/DNA-binding Xre family transcriptional regulator